MAWCRQALRLLTGLYDTTFSLVHNELKSGNRITQNTDKFKLHNFRQHIFLKEKLALLLYLLPHNRRGNDFSNQYSFLCEQDKVTPGLAAHPELALDLVIPGRVLAEADHIVLFLEVVSFLQGCLLSFKVSVFVRTFDFKKSRSTLRAMYQTIIIRECPLQPDWLSLNVWLDDLLFRFLGEWCIEALKFWPLSQELFLRLSWKA